MAHDGFIQPLLFSKVVVGDYDFTHSRKLNKSIEGIIEEWLFEKRAWMQNEIANAPNGGMKVSVWGEGLLMIDSDKIFPKK